MKLIPYDSTRTYMFPNSELATPERVAQDFPAAAHFRHVIETDDNEEMLFGIFNLSAMRTQYKVDPALSEGEAIAAIQAQMEADRTPSSEPGAEERIAAALEYQNLMNL